MTGACELNFAYSRLFGKKICLSDQKSCSKTNIEMVQKLCSCKLQIFQIHKQI